ncbi:MAG: DUF4184 family protein [Kineosporiaceae bacterium]
MPFTPAHAAAVRPLTRWGLPTSALVVGSMAPDFPYYVPDAWRVLPNGLTHSVVGIVTVDVLLGVLGLALWHGLLAPLAVQAAPPSWRVRFARIGQGRPAAASAAGSPTPSAASTRGSGRAGGSGRGLARGRGRRLAAVVAALVVGATTHVVWDEFTHARRFADRHLAPFSASWAGQPGWWWAQQLSGVVGLLVVGWWVAGRWRESARAGKSRRASGRGGALRQAPPDTALAVVARLGLLAAAVLALAVGVRTGLHGTSVSGTGYAVATRAGAAAGAVVLPLSVGVRVAAEVLRRRA